MKDRLQSEPPQRKALTWGVALGVLGVAALAALFLVFDRGGRPVLENAALETAGDTLALTLVDGSSLTLGSRTRVQVVEGNAEAVELVVARGQIACDVTHRPRRSFVVRASGVEVRVVGTRFSVSDEPGVGGVRVAVNVERGIVEVVSERHPGAVTRVAAGQSFSEWIPTPAAAPSVSAASASTVAALDSAVPAADSPAPALAASAAQASKSGTHHAVGGDDATLPRDPTARELLDSANTARRAGDARAAADEYRQLLQKFPGDGRAGLAAFELGRLRMDRLADLPGAVQALERAVQLASGAGFREDAMARLVTAYAALGRSADCGRSRDAYLAAFPNGVHREVVARGCGAR